MAAMLRRIQFAMLSSLFVAGALLARAQNPSGHLSPDDKAAHSLFTLVNQERVQRGLQPLQWDPELAASARVRLTATQGSISHTGDSELAKRAQGAGAYFNGIAESEVSEMGIASVEDIRWGNVEWMALPKYRANVLNPFMDSIGIAAEIRGGTVHVVEDLAHRVEPLSLAEQEKRVAEKIRDYVPVVTGPAEVDTADRACEHSVNAFDKQKVDFTSSYTTVDLGQLPDELIKKLASGKYSAASVGACNPEAGNFYIYRIGVALYLRTPPPQDTNPIGMHTWP